METSKLPVPGSWPEGAVFTDGQGNYFDEQAQPLAPAGVLAMSKEFRDCVAARPLAYSLDDYWHAPAGTGPLGFTWKDKPHRVVYDLLAALRFCSEQLERHLAESRRSCAEGAAEVTTPACEETGKDADKGAL